jgi:hypothetical protein
MANVRYWHKADMLNALTNVRFERKIGHDASSLMAAQTQETFNFVAGANGQKARAMRPASRRAVQCALRP